MRSLVSMMRTNVHQCLITHVAAISPLVVVLLFTGTATAEVRTISATGEYRMGDNDTRTDAKRFALLDAKRLALEQAGVYIESIVEVKGIDLTREEIRSYTAGILEVAELATKDTVEGSIHIIRMDVSVKIDTDLVPKQIDALRKNESVKTEMLRLRTELDKLQRELTEPRVRGALLPSATIREEQQFRTRSLNRLEANYLLSRAWAKLDFFKGPITTDAIHEARLLAEKALAVDPGIPEAHLTRGYILHLQKSLDEARHEFEEALRINPENSGAHFYLAGVLYDLGDWKGAAEEYEQTLRLDSFYPAKSLLSATYHQLGLKARKDGDLEKAATYFLKLIELEPNGFSGHVLLAVTLSERGSLDESIEEFRHALRILPESSIAHLEFGNALKRKGDLANAIKEYRQGVSFEPNFAAGHFALGLALYEQGDTDSAAASFREAHRLEPAFPATEAALEKLTPSSSKQ